MLAVGAGVATAIATAALGATSVAFGTAAGRNLVVHSVIDYANAVLGGTLTVDSVGGAIFHGLDAWGVTLTGDDGIPLAAISRLSLRYRLQDLLQLRIVLGELTIAHPRVTIVEYPHGGFNYQRVLKLGQGTGGGPSPLIAFAHVTIEDGRVVLRSQMPADSGSPPRHLTIDHATLPYLRLASPRPSERGIRADVAELEATLSRPALAIHGMRGTVTLVGDSVALALDRLRLGATAAAVHGAVWALSSGPYLDLDIDASSFATRDVRPLVGVLPNGLTGSGRFHVALGPDDALTFGTHDLDARAAEGGRMRGSLVYAARPGGRFTIQNLDVTTDSFPVHYLRAIFDTIPVAGRLSGRTRLDGPNDGMSARVDLRFADARAPAAPHTEFAGDGTIRVSHAAGLTFRAFAVRRAHVALATVHELIPSVKIGGVLDAVGTLDGDWRNAAFSGSLRHVPTEGPVSVARGVARFDTRRDTTGVFADLQFDSLAVDGLRSAYPDLPLVGKFAGEVHLAGYADSLSTRFNFRGPTGALDGSGTLVLVPPHIGVRGLDLTVDSLDVDSTLAPDTRVTGTARGRVETDTLTAPRIAVAVRLRGSTVGGVAIDSARARVRTADSTLHADTLRVWASGLAIRGGGGLALSATGTDSLRLETRIDSLDAVLPLVAQWLPAAALAASDTVRGSVSGDVTIRGSVRHFAIHATADVRAVRWNEVRTPRAHADAQWASDAAGRIAFGVSADTLSVGRLGFAAIAARLDGRRDSLDWGARARMGSDGSFIAGGRLARDSETVVRFDSLAVLLASNVWFLDRGATITLDDSAVTLAHFALAVPSGASRISFDGTIPRVGPGHLTGRLEGVGLADVWALAQQDVSGVSGQLSGTLDLRGTARAPVVDASLAMRDGVFGDFHAPYLEGHFAYADEQLHGDVGLWRAGQQILNVNLALPVDLALRGAPARELPGPISVRATADAVDLSVIDAFSSMVRNAGGRLSADVGITGTWDSPQLTGTLSVTDGAATFPALGVRHEKLNGELTLSGDTIRVRRLSVESNGGTAQLSGYVELAGLTKPILHLDISAREFRAIDVRNFLAMTASGQLHLQGPMYHATLTGSGTVTHGTLYFADIIEKDIINLEDTLYAGIVDTALIREQGLGPRFQSRFLDSLRIDSLQLTMGSDVWMRSDEADIQLSGPVTIGKIAKQYRLDGTLTTPRGNYRLPLGPTITKDFTVTRGEVRYFGTPDLNASLDIDARHTLRTQRGETIAIFVHVGGTINAPTLTLSSDQRPPLSETEIISYLLFGAPSVQAAGGSGVVGNTARQMVATAASKITGALGSSLISDLGVPLDIFEVRPEIGARGYEGTEIALGRQLGERWFLTLSPRLCTQQQLTYKNLGASLEFQMTKHWRISASADPLKCEPLGGQGTSIGYQLGLDVLWERRY